MQADKRFESQTRFQFICGCARFFCCMVWTEVDARQPALRVYHDLLAEIAQLVAHAHEKTFSAFRRAKRAELQENLAAFITIGSCHNGNRDFNLRNDSNWRGSGYRR